VRRHPLLALCLGLAFPLRAQAQEGEPPLLTPAERAAAAPAQERPPPPYSLRNRPPLIEEEYQRKKEGSYFTGLPLANSDPTSGIGFGARVYYFENGDRRDPRFAYTPYLHRIFLQTFFSTGGLQFHWLDYDAPSIGGSAYRLRASAILGRNTLQNYFGRGERSMRDLSYTGAGNFRKFENYQASLDQIDGAGLTRTLYDKFDVLRPQLLFSLERSLLGGLLRPLVGLGFSYNQIRDYTGKVVSVGSTGADAVMAPTRLSEDCAAGRLVGCDGGFENILRLALVFDTRDFEPDPNSGLMAEVSGEFGTKVLGSKFDFARVLGTVRGYYSPFPSVADVVLAGRFVYQVQTEGTPFFSMNVMPFSEDFRLGIGGVRTLRGYAQDRFVGPVMAVANFEVRWTVGHLKGKGQDFGFILAPFVDLARVFDKVSDTSLKDWKRGQGAGLRVAWNQATIVMVDLGFSVEETRVSKGLYINFNHIF